MFDDDDPRLARVRELALAFPDAAEKVGGTAAARLLTSGEKVAVIDVAALGLDADGDMALTDAEQVALLAHVEDRPADHAGDLVAMQGDAPLAPAPRRETGAA